MKTKLLYQVKNVTASLCFYLLILSSASATNYYVSPTGNDSNNGTSAASAFFNISQALTKAATGDVINVASGTYAYSKTIQFTKSGITLKGIFTTPSARPVLNFSSIGLGDSNFGIHLTGSDNYFYGIIIKGAGDNGLQIDKGNNNKIEFCDFLENQDTGLQLKSGASHNKIINCDSYYNVDPAQGNADGFADKLDEGGFNSFRGCRAWQNSDDGWDGLLKDQTYTPTDTIVNSWCYKNGYLKSGSASSGNGNGFKLGGNYLIHNQYVFNCLSVLNRSKGFDQNHDVGSMTLYNCSAYNNGAGNYVIKEELTSDGTTSGKSTGATLTVKNCLSYEKSFGGLNTKAVQATNSWLSPFSVSASDFVSTDDSQLLLPRKADGSLPDITFMHLAAGSDLIDAGTNVGLPYAGSKPDLGCFESGSSAPANTPPTVSITSPVANSTFNAPAAITIVATATDADGTISKVQFYNGNTLLGSNATSPYSFSWTNVSAGTYSITAKATDNAGAVTTSSAVSITVSSVVVTNTPPTVSLTSPVANSTFNAPASITIAATSTDADGTISKVQFYNGNTLLGSDAASPYSFSWTNVSAGTYSITAKATDNAGAVTTSSAVSITVSSVVVANTPPTVSLTSPVANSTFNAPASITIAATATDADGTISSVQFYNGNTLLGSDATSPYSFSWTNVSAGTYSITAKATDNAGAVTTSVAISIMIVSADPAVDISGSDCGIKNGSGTYELSAINRTNASSYSWWFTGSSQSITAVAGTPYQAVLSYGSFFNTGQVCVGVNYSTAPWYNQFCKTIAVCGARFSASFTEENMIENSTFVSPNPSESDFNLIPSKDAQSLDVVDVFGHVVYSQSTILSGKQLIFGQDFPAGMYLVKILYADGITEVKKINKLR